MPWRTGNKVKLNVYEGDSPMFQCHTVEAAERIVNLLNASGKFLVRLDPYIFHEDNCNINRLRSSEPDSKVCNCGLNALLDEIK